jgi:hypothetical protein
LVVNFGYYGGNPIPSDPSAYRPGAIIPSPADILTTIAKIPQAIERTVAAALGPLQPRKLPAANQVQLTTDTTEPSDAEPKPTIREQLEQAAEDAGLSDFLKPKKPKPAVNKPLLNVVRDSLTHTPGARGDDEAGGGAGTKPGKPEDAEGTGQPTDPPPTDPGGTGNGSGTESGGTTATNNDNGGAAAA